MNLPKLYSDAEYPQSAEHPQGDELDRLVRGALQTRVEGQQPSEHVWKRIKLELERDEAPPRRFQISWSPLVLQTAVTLLLVMLAGAGLQMLFSLDHIRDSSPVTVIDIDEGSAFSSGAPISDEPDLRQLKMLHRPGSELDAALRATGAEPDNQPPIMVPLDVPQNASSPAGRLLESEPSLRPRPVAGGRSVLGGPSEK